MTALELISLIAAIFSLVLAVTAISLSIVFYKMSSQLSESAKDAAKDIGASVQKLEKLFDKLYADTFSMMKDTVTDMRKHIWPKEASSEEREGKIDKEAELKADQKVESLRSQVKNNIDVLLKRLELTDARLGEVKGEMSKIMDNVISKSRKAEHEARGEIIRGKILDAYSRLDKGAGYVLAHKLVYGLDGNFDSFEVVDEIEEMKEQGILDFEGSSVDPDSKVTRK